MSVRCWRQNCGANFSGACPVSLQIAGRIGFYATISNLRERASADRKHPIKDDYPGCWGVATFASNTKSHDDKGRGRPGDCLLRREQDQLQTAPV